MRFRIQPRTSATATPLTELTTFVIPIKLPSRSASGQGTIDDRFAAFVRWVFREDNENRGLIFTFALLVFQEIAGEQASEGQAAPVPLLAEKRLDVAVHFVIPAHPEH
jgi:hypothetical protein